MPENPCLCVCLYIHDHYNYIAFLFYFRAMQGNITEMKPRLSSDYLVSLKLWRFGGPVLLLIGSVLNCLAIIIFLHPRNRYYPMFVLLIALCCADLVGLWTSFTQQWLIQQHDIHVDTYSVIGCKLHVFLVRVSLQCSSWLLVALSAERLVTITFPDRIKVIFSLANTCIIIGTIVLVSFLLNFHVLVNFSIRVYYYGNKTYIYTCEKLSTPDASIEHGSVPYWIDLLLVYILPMVYLSLSNIALFIFKSKRNVKNTSKKSESVFKMNDFLQLTSVVIRLNFLFIVCTAPGRLYRLFHESEDLRVSFGRKTILQAVFFLLSFASNVLNFVICYISCSKFRKDFRELLLERQLNWFS
jgi:growth hormone secretagogue receptor